MNIGEWLRELGLSTTARATDRPTTQGGRAMPHIPQQAAINHRFAIGSMVRLNQNVFTRFVVRGVYEILAQLPERDGRLQYRIKSGSEPYQRVAREDELEPE